MLFLLPPLAAAVLAVHALQAGPTPPPRFRGPDAIARPLDQRLREEGPAALTGSPGDWCPTGPGFNRWLAERGIISRPDAPQVPPKTLTAGHAKTLGATPLVRLESGVVVMEDDGTLTRYDRRPDLEGLTVDLTPTADGYSVVRRPIAWENVTGTVLFTGQRGWAEQAVDLAPFTFPFGGASQARVFVTSAMSVTFADPVPPSPAQLHLSDVLANRMPRISPFEGGTSLYGWDASYAQGSDRAIFTWMGVDGGGLDVEVQEVLFSDGTIRFNYRSLRGTDHGSMAVVGGTPGWWDELASGGTTTDPLGDVDVPAPDGPAIDVVAVRASQVGGSELLQVDVEMAAPLPAATDGTLQFAFEIRDEPGGPVLNTLWAEWEDGRWNWTNYPAEAVGSSMRLSFNRTDLPLQDDDLEVLAWTGQSGAWKQVVAAMVSWPLAPVPLMRDVTTMGPELARGPLVEAFTLPELQIGPVYDAFNRQFGSPRIDGLAVYQDFLTDIAFYAGAWSTVGNAHADGIGVGSSTEPESPELLHMNEIRYGWNASDSGKITVLSHEGGHHWLYFPSIMEGGVVGKPLGDGHPAGWVHAPSATPIYNAWDASCMGGSTWTDNGDGTFTSTPGFASYGYSWQDLYFMGLADPAEVPDFFYLRDSVPALPGAYWPPDNSNVTATRVNVTVQQFVDAMGPRNPARADSRKDFIIPMVLVVRPGEMGPDDVGEVVHTCDIWSAHIGVATLGRGTMTCNRVSLVNRAPTAAIVQPAADVRIEQGDTIDFVGEGQDPDGDPVELSWNFDGAAPAATGPGPQSITFPDQGWYAVQLGARDPSGLVSDWSDVRIVQVSCRTPAEVQGLRVAHDRASGRLTFTWDDPSLAPDDFVVLASSAATGFTQVAAGASGVAVPVPPGRVVYFKVAARNLPDCVGGY